MNSLEIEKIIRKDIVLSKTFLGIFASDQLNFKITKRPCSMIVNTDPSSLPGTHWIAIYFDNHGDVKYFDSYGRKPFLKQFDVFLKLNARKKDTNPLRLQSDDSYVCGMYCIYFLYLCVRHRSMKQILNKFTSKNVVYNDRIVCKFMYDRFRVRHAVCS